MIAALLCLICALLTALLWAVIGRGPHRQFVFLEQPEDYPGYTEWREAQLDAARLMLRAGVAITLTEWICLSPETQEDISAAAVEIRDVERMLKIADEQAPADALVGISETIEPLLPGTTARWMSADAQAEGRRMAHTGVPVGGD